MTTDIKDSIKARLYDMKYTPFAASYIFAWLFFNAKSILIFFSNKLSITEKINMLSYDSIEYILPLIFGLIYTIVFPLFNAILYYITLQYRRLMNGIKQKIQDVTPLPQEEANKIIKENMDLELKLNSKIKEIDEIKSSFENKRNKYIEKEKELENNINQKVLEATKILKSENQKLLKDINNKEEKIQDLLKQLNVFEQNHQNKSVDDIISDDNIDIILTNDERKFLKIIYENDISSQSHSNYINKILATKKFKRIKIQDLLNSLEVKGIIKKDTYNYDITEEGQKIILALFDVKT